MSIIIIIITIINNL